MHRHRAEGLPLLRLRGVRTVGFARVERKRGALNATRHALHRLKSRMRLNGMPLVCPPDGRGAWGVERSTHSGDPEKAFFIRVGGLVPWLTLGGSARQAMDGLWTEARGQQKQSNDLGNNQHNPQYANYWAPLTRKRHPMPHSAQPQHTNHWAPRTRIRHQQEHRPQRPTERSDPTQHTKGRTGDRPGPHKEKTTRRNVTQGA